MHFRSFEISVVQPGSTLSLPAGQKKSEHIKRSRHGVARAAMSKVLTSSATSNSARRLPRTHQRRLTSSQSRQSSWHSSRLKRLIASLDEFRAFTKPMHLCRATTSALMMFQREIFASTGSTKGGASFGWSQQCFRPDCGIYSIASPCVTCIFVTSGASWTYSWIT